MRKLLMLLAVLFVAAIPARAQDSYPSAEIFGGYSYLSVDLGTDPDFFNDREGAHGIGFSVAGNFSDKFGIVGDFSYNRRDIETRFGDLDASAFIFLFGPRFSARAERATGFAHFLVGGARSKLEGASDTNLALGIGGGADINATKNVAVRLFQLDYIPVRAGGEWFHNFRVQAGIVFKVE